jgi:hypothetical protein
VWRCGTPCRREHLGVHPCDRRLRISDKVPLFPAIDFSAISEDEDPLWTLDTRETKAAIMARGRAFLEQVLARPEHSIAVRGTWVDGWWNKGMECLEMSEGGVSEGGKRRGGKDINHHAAAEAIGLSY